MIFVSLFFFFLICFVVASFQPRTRHEHKHKAHKCFQRKIKSKIKSNSNGTSSFNSNKNLPQRNYQCEWLAFWSVYSWEKHWDSSQHFLVNNIQNNYSGFLSYKIITVIIAKMKMKMKIYKRKTEMM